MTLGVRMKQVRSVALAAAIAAAAVPSVHAQTPRPMTLVDVAALPRALDPAISPDGRFVSYMLQRPSWATGRKIP